MLEQELVHDWCRELVDAGRTNKAFWNVQDAVQVQLTAGTKSPSDFLEHRASEVRANLSHLPPPAVKLTCLDAQGMITIHNSSP